MSRPTTSGEVVGNVPLVETVDVDSLGDEDNLYLVGLTSHGVVNVLVELEDHLQIELPDTLLHRDTFSSIAALREAVLSTGLVEDAR